MSHRDVIAISVFLHAAIADQQNRRPAQHPRLWALLDWHELRFKVQIPAARVAQRTGAAQVSFSVTEGVFVGGQDSVPASCSVSC